MVAQPSPPVPVVVVTGVDPAAMAATTIGLQWDLPRAVVAQHTLDADRSTLTRTVSDVSGLVEQQVLDLGHACVSCALREDILPTVRRLAASGRWGAVVAVLPVAADARQVGRALRAGVPGRRSLRLAGVLACVDGHRLSDNLLGDALLRERGLHTAYDDQRGVGEVAAAQVELADAVVVTGGLDAPERDLLRALVRPGTPLVDGPDHLDARRLLGGKHSTTAAEAWTHPVRRGPLRLARTDHVWTVDLVSDRPLHPDRLLRRVADLGGGPWRSRGCFWLPTRPGVCGVWDGAGGQLSIGPGEPWGSRRPLTRIVVTGMDDGAEDLHDAFEDILLTPAEIASRGQFWEVRTDGLEPWLGDIRRVA